MMARILYIQPTTKSVVLTTLPHIVDYSGAPVKTSLTQYDKGDIIEEARVLYTDHKRGAYLKIQDGVTALASVRITCLNLRSDKLNFEIQAIKIRIVSNKQNHMINGTCIYQ